MSLIRYSADDSRSVVLRHQQTLVLYDPHSRQIILREASPSSHTETTNPQACPFCKRPMHHGEEPAADPLGPALGHHRSRSNTPLAESGFVDQQYFRMLDSSIPVEGSDTREPRRSVPLSRLKPEKSLGHSDDGQSEEEVPSSHHGAGIEASAFSPGYFERFFIIERELGRGGKGVVLLVRHVLDGVSLGNFACKRVPVGNNHEWLEKVLMEVQLLQRLSYPNLVSYRHVWLENSKLSTFGPSVPCAFILQQYCNSGDLHHYILGSAKPATKESLKDRLRRKSRGKPEPVERPFQPRRLPFKQIISFFQDIAKGLNHLHSNGFIHRDLKPSNCLLHETGIVGEELKVLVSDFGEVQMKNEARKSTGTTGTISYCAPEVLKRAPGGEYQNFTTKSDVFSLGMILHFICFGKLPYVSADQMNEENEDLDALREEISAWQGLDEQEIIRTDLPERLYHSLKTLVNPDPTVRPSAEDILLGIEMNIGEESPPMRRGSISSQKSVSIDESQALGFRRISPVADSPRSMTPIDPLTVQIHQENSPFKGKVKPNTEQRNSGPITPRKTSKLSQSSKLSSSPPRRQVIGASTESSMILRPRIESPKPAVFEPALEEFSTSSDRSESAIAPEYIMPLKVIVFFIKAVSLSHPCMPAAPKSSIYYPMIGLAILDFTTPLLMPTAVLGITHTILIFLIRMFGDLCMY